MFSFLLIGGFIAVIITLFMDYEAARIGTPSTWYEVLGNGDAPMSKDHFVEYKLAVLCAWVGWTVFSTLVSAGERGLFYYMGEKLSY